MLKSKQGQSSPWDGHQGRVLSPAGRWRAGRSELLTLVHLGILLMLTEVVLVPDGRATELAEPRGAFTVLLPRDDDLGNRGVLMPRIMSSNPASTAS